MSKWSKKHITSTQCGNVLARSCLRCPCHLSPADSDIGCPYQSLRCRRSTGDVEPGTAPRPPHRSKSPCPAGSSWSYTGCSCSDDDIASSWHDQLVIHLASLSPAIESSSPSHRTGTRSSQGQPTASRPQLSLPAPSHRIAGPRLRLGIFPPATNLRHQTRFHLLARIRPPQQWQAQRSNPSTRRRRPGDSRPAVALPAPSAKRRSKSCMSELSSPPRQEDVLTLRSKEDYDKARTLAFDALKSRAYLYPIKVPTLSASIS